jgi:hypothetical protein
MLLWATVDRKAARMPHLKCEACRVRLRRVRQPVGLTEACPLCGRPLQSVDDLSELIGLASIDPRPDGVGVGEGASGEGGSVAGHDRLAAAVADVIARRRAAERRSRLWPQ